ncbi:thioredoxin family protein [Marilutibacter maris]|uniref:Putative Thioredoxin (H-type, TRX-H) n=1 Tax=Marilutibacter maris TaxID=1605891 RepID=A0A2U9TII6_9GAMM|nr:thioredoxin family protein [Lysobacter maris]AWV07920.1 putative Thioredoxin (H-type, TRX-H) [Lysobacter maris]
MPRLFTPRSLSLTAGALLLALATAFAAFSAGADDRADFLPYSAARLAALQAEGRPVLVDVHADWCPTCRRQGPILARLLAEPELAGYAALKLDWDDQRDAARELGAPRQSTLFVFKDGNKLGMSVAETDEARLRGFLRQGVK